MDKFWENYIATRPTDSKGAFDAFKQMNQDPRSMAQGPRNMADGGRIGYKDGEGVITVDDKIDEMIAHFQRYLKKGGKMDFKTFSKKYIPENFADGGRARFENGEIVKPSASMMVDTTTSDTVAKGLAKKLLKYQEASKGVDNQTKQYLMNLFQKDLENTGYTVEDVMRHMPRNTYSEGQLVTPSVDGSRPGYGGPGFKSEETQKKIQKITEEKITKRVNQIKKINDWTNNWFENNAGKYNSYEKAKTQLIKDWKKESKNKKYAGNFKLSLENGLPNIAAGTAEGSKATKVSNRIFDLNFPIQRSNKELIFQKGYANYRLQNPNFNKKINDYFDLIILDKRSYDVQQNLIQSGKLKEGYGVIRTATGDYTGSSSKSMKGKQALDALNIDKEVLKFITTYMKPDSAFFSKTGGENIYDIVGKHVDPEKVKNYRNKINMGVDNWRANLDAVVDLANKDLPPSKHLSSSQLVTQMRNESNKMAKLLGLKDLPNELKYFGYSQDHLLGIKEALELGDSKMARKTLKTMSGTTRAQNTFLGFKEFGNERRRLIKEFNAAPSNARGPIIKELNLLSQKFLPDQLEYGVRKKDGSMKVKILQPQKTKKSRIASYKKVLGESINTLDLSSPEGRLKFRQIGTTKVLNKILEKNNIKICNDQLSEGKGVVCGAKFAEKDPNAFMEAIKRNNDAVKIINKPGLIKGALRGVSAWAKKELGPMGWIGSIATIDSAFGLHALGQGKTPLQALDTTLWFLPKSVLKADEKMFKNVYEKAGYTEEDFGEFQKWRELEDLDRQYFKAGNQLKFMEGQVLEPEKKSVADIAYQKEVDALPDMYKDMGWNRPLFTITSKEEKTGEHPFYGPAVDRYNKIIDKSDKVYESLKDPDKSWKDLDYTRKLVAMEEANRKKKLMRQSLKHAPHLLPLLHPSSIGGKNFPNPSDFMHDEYVHPLYGPSVSPEQIAAVDEGRFRAQLYSAGGRAGYMGGGIAAIRKPSEIPPERQGLRSIMINAKDN